MKPRIHIDDIRILKDSYKAPDGYFDSLRDKLDARKDEILPKIKLEHIQPLEESYQVSQGYFEGLMDKIEERKGIEENVVAFRSKTIRIWGALVAAACIAMVVLSVVNWGPGQTEQNLTASDYKLNLPDAEIATLLNDRDDEFALTDDEIIEVFEHESKQSESVAIINYLQDEGAVNEDGTNEEDFFESM